MPLISTLVVTAYAIKIAIAAFIIDAQIEIVKVILIKVSMQYDIVEAFHKGLEDRISSIRNFFQS